MKLIDADALKDNMFHYAAPEMVWDRDDIEHKINEMPTIDAIPVIRCKDCGFFVANNTEEGDWSGKCTNVYLPMNGATVDGWWFCADGQKG